MQNQETSMLKSLQTMPECQDEGKMKYELYYDEEEGEQEYLLESKQ